MKIACVYGCPVRENINHLFMYCVKLKGVWENIQLWRGLSVVGNVDCANYFLHFMEDLKAKCSSKRAGAI